VVHEGSKDFMQVLFGSKFKKYLNDSRRFNQVQEASTGFYKVQEGSRRLKKIQED